MKQKSGTLKKIGVLCLIIGILALFLGILLLLFASYGTLAIICSMVLNIMGISFITYKPYE